MWHVLVSVKAFWNDPHAMAFIVSSAALGLSAEEHRQAGSDYMNEQHRREKRDEYNEIEDAVITFPASQVDKPTREQIAAAWSAHVRRPLPYWAHFDFKQDAPSQRRGPALSPK